MCPQNFMVGKMAYLRRYFCSEGALFWYFGSSSFILCIYYSLLMVRLLCDFLKSRWFEWRISLWVQIDSTPLDDVRVASCACGYLFLWQYNSWSLIFSFMDYHYFIWGHFGGYVHDTHNLGVWCAVFYNCLKCHIHWYIHLCRSSVMSFSKFGWYLCGVLIVTSVFLCVSCRYGLTLVASIVICGAIRFSLDKMIRKAHAPCVISNKLLSLCVCLHVHLECSL